MSILSTVRALLFCDRLQSLQKEVAVLEAERKQHDTALMQHDAELIDRCAETAFSELDDPYLSGHGYATRVSYAIRQLAAEKEKRDEKR